MKVVLCERNISNLEFDPCIVYKKKKIHKLTGHDRLVEDRANIFIWHIRIIGVNV